MARGKPRKLAGLNFNVRMPRVSAQDPLEQQKRQRQRQLRPQLRSRRSTRPSQRAASASLAQRIKDLFNEPIHPWWHHLPADVRTQQHQFRILTRRLLAWLKRKPQRIALTVIAYLVTCAVPLLGGLPLISVVAILPLILVPPVGFLVYWLVWMEFHH